MTGPGLAAYLLGPAAFTIAAGSVTDLLVFEFSIDIGAQLADGRHLFPVWLQATAMALLVVFAIPALRTSVFQWAARARFQRG